MMVGPYRLRRPIGRGHTAIVYEADDASQSRRVAVKLIPQDAGGRRGAKTLLHEARIAAMVRHPNVVRALDCGAWSGGVYLVMELVDGSSLEPLVAAGPTPWRTATTLLVSACAGLEALHACGILHRDIKPANIVRTRHGTAKLVDFGLARRLDERPSSGPVGTPHYMSPEQCCGELDDERTDIYSLGATYCSLLTGRTPYPEAASPRVMLDHCSAPVPDPRSSGPVPDACAEIVLRAMAKRRADRFAGARAMGEALRAALARDALGGERLVNRPRGRGYPRETEECPIRRRRT